MATIDFTKVSTHDSMKHVFRVVGYRKGVRRISTTNLTYIEARSLAKRDSSLTIYSLRGLCPTI